MGLCLAGASVRVEDITEALWGTRASSGTVPRLDQKIYARTLVRIRNKMKRSLYWWDPVDGSINVGDYLSKVIVAKILESRGTRIADKTSKKNRLLAIGSILHYANTDDCIWGTGRNGNISEGHYKFTSLDVRAVRGPLTRDYLLKRGIACPDRFGDPALLAPWLFPRQLFEGTAPHRDYIVIPHFLTDLSKLRLDSQHLCMPMLMPAEFIRRIVNSSLVISSSLHGLILAEAYGVPTVFLNVWHTENILKYEDYYLGTGRKNCSSVSSIEEALAVERASPPDFTQIQRSLLDAFPFDLWAC